VICDHCLGNHAKCPYSKEEAAAVKKARRRASQTIKTAPSKPSPGKRV